MKQLKLEPQNLTEDALKCLIDIFNKFGKNALFEEQHYKDNNDIDILKSRYLVSKVLLDSNDHEVCDLSNSSTEGYKSIIQSYKVMLRLNFSPIDLIERKDNNLVHESEHDTLSALIEKEKLTKDNAFLALNTLVNSNITKFEMKLLYKLLDIESNKKIIGVTQKEFLEYYNNFYYDELDHLNETIKQSQLSRSLKSLEKQDYINIRKSESNQLTITTNAKKFRFMS